MDPADSLDLAKFLDGLPSGAPREAMLRGACGRAYYAAFGVIRDALLNVPLAVPKDGTAHAVMISTLKKSTLPGVAAIGSLMDQLRTARNNADYKVGKLSQQTFTQRESRLAIVMAQQSILDIRRLATAHRRLGL